MNRINPFRPNSPINPGMFVGRIKEIERLELALLQTRAEQPSHFMITGERGIGKTSLLMYIRAVAKSLIPIEKEKVNFLVIDIDVDQATTRLGLVKKIELGLNRELGKSEPARNFLKETWNFLKRIEAGGISIKEGTSASNEEILLDEFAYSLAKVADRTCKSSESEPIFNSKYDGIIIMLDEADNSPRNLALGSFFKLLIERLQRHGCEKLMVGLAGLPELRKVLHDSHPSSLRIFEEIPLERLLYSEVNDVIDICLEKANKENIQKTQIDTKAKGILIGFSEGYPHFIQQFGYSSFSVDTDGNIDEEDVMKGALNPRGALQIIGDRYYRNNFYSKIRKDSYRQVLRIMADKLDSWIKKAEIKRKFKSKKTTLDNAIKALRDRHIILSKEGERGVYRLQHRGFALWIKLCTTDPSELKENL